MNNADVTQHGWQMPTLPPVLPAKPPRKKLLALLLLAAAALLMLLFCLMLGAFVLYGGSLSRILAAVEPSCTIGIAGSAATITIQGWSAAQDCNQILSGQPSFLDSSGKLAGGIYQYTETPTNPVVCELNDQGRHVIVRDEGMLMLVGNSLCQWLEQQVADGT